MIDPDDDDREPTEEELASCERTLDELFVEPDYADGIRGDVGIEDDNDASE